MRYWTVALFIGMLASRPAAAQTAQTKPEQLGAGQGYVFFAPGAVAASYGSSALLHFGGGIEARMYRGLGVGLELGMLGPPHAIGAGFGMFSVDALYTFGRRTAKLSPFVTGGYSLAFREGVASGVNFGVGAHYWFSRRVGLRFEARDHVMVAYRDAHFLGARVGLAFR
jgi:hypothetical protein